MFSFSKKGFTLIELLIVVSIIGILSTVVLASLSKARSEARVSRAQLELRQLQRIMLEFQLTNNSSLLSVTGRDCSDCVCRERGDLSQLPETDRCVTNWRGAITRIVQSTNPGQDPSGFFTDPWGSPYLLDENEGERLAHGPCRSDLVRSAGPDKSVGPETLLDPGYIPTPVDVDDVDLLLFRNLEC